MRKVRHSFLADLESIDPSLTLQPFRVSPKTGLRQVIKCYVRLFVIFMQCFFICVFCLRDFLRFYSAIANDEDQSPSQRAIEP